MSASVERILHLNCKGCKGWWTVCDPPADQCRVWYCTWCGRLEDHGRAKEWNLTAEAHKAISGGRKDEDRGCGEPIVV